MKIITWNVNGIRALLKKEDLRKDIKTPYTFSDFINEYEPDVLCLQETKLQKDMSIDLGGLEKKYETIYNSAEKKGYSGTAVLTKIKPENIYLDMDYEKNKNGSEESFDIHNEGRLITTEFKNFFLVNEYTPNYGRELETGARNNHLPERAGFRMYWEDERKKYLQTLDKKKPIILCGDLNVAHEEIDLKNPKTNRNNAGFTDEEREKMTTLLSSGFTDIFRKKYPSKEDAYTWWSYRFNARQNNSGWRIDYFICSDKLFSKIKSIEILNGIYGSDHCPVMLEI